MAITQFVPGRTMPSLLIVPFAGLTIWYRPWIWLFGPAAVTRKVPRGGVVPKPPSTSPRLMTSKPFAGIVPLPEVVPVLVVPLAGRKR